MSYWELEPEAWELLPDDSYDGAKHMEHRGRIEVLERRFQLDSQDNAL